MEFSCHRHFGVVCDEEMCIDKHISVEADGDHLCLELDTTGWYHDKLLIDSMCWITLVGIMLSF